MSDQENRDREAEQQEAEQQETEQQESGDFSQDDASGAQDSSEEPRGDGGEEEVREPIDLFGFPWSEAAPEKKKWWQKGKFYGCIAAVAFGIGLAFVVGLLIGYRLAPSKPSSPSYYQPSTIQVDGSTPSAVAVAAVAKPATVLIQCGQSYGTGFFIRENGYIATNYHVVQGVGDIVVKTYAGETKSAILCGYSRHDDLAVIKIDGYGYPTGREDKHEPERKLLVAEGYRCNKPRGEELQAPAALYTRAQR